MNDKHLYLRGATFALALLAAVTVIGLAWAQGGGDTPDCSETKTFSDKGCGTDTNCPPSGLTGCTNYDFTPACTGSYFLDCWMVCTGTFCHHCKSCVVIYDDTFEIAHCTTDSCDNNDCNHTAGSVSLTAGHPYTVYVCMTRCQNNPNCDACTDANGCIAWGCLRLGRTAPCWP